MDRKGFTLIELMIVVSIVGILAAIAVPRYAETIRRSQEARTKGNAAMFNEAIAMYYTDRGIYPTDNLASLIPQYLDRIPLKYTPSYHPEGNSVQAGPDAAMTDSTGDWYYFNLPGEANYGRVVVNCIHHDLSGRVWSSL